MPTDSTCFRTKLSVLPPRIRADLLEFIAKSAVSGMGEKAVLARLKTSATLHSQKFTRLAS